MRHLIALATAVVLVLAGCAGAATPTAEPAASSIASASVEPAPTAPATAIAEPLDVRVTFDGERCTYEGPTVFLDGTKVRFEFSPSSEMADVSALEVSPVLAGISREQAREAADEGRANDPPPWLYEAGQHVVIGAGTMPYMISSRLFETALGGHLVLCVTSPETTNAVYFGELLAVAGGN